MKSRSRRWTRAAGTVRVLSRKRMPRRVVIIGGGVIGAACAHYLGERDWRVTIVDQGRFAGGCSHGNCGYVCPSHVLPLAEPGAVRRALRAMLSSGSPFYIKPRLDPALWGWLWRFARQCRTDRMMKAGRAIHGLLRSSMSLYCDLIPRYGLECEWERRGLMFVYRDAAAMEAFAATNALLSESFGEPAERLDGEAARAKEPALRPGAAGGWFYESDAHLRSDRLMAEWRRLLESRGVEIREHCSFSGFTRAADGASAALTTDGPIDADAFVVAAGAWTPRFRRQLGCRIPIQPGKGYSITTSRPDPCPRVPMIFPETRVAVTPFASGYRIGSMMEFAGYDATIRPDRLALLRRGAEPFLSPPCGDEVRETWYGWRPMTSDGVPIIDFSPALPNVMIAAGHNMLGLSMATGTGRLVAEMMSGAPPHLDPAPYSARRM